MDCCPWYRLRYFFPTILFCSCSMYFVFYSIVFLQSFPPFFSHRVFRGFSQTHLLYLLFFLYLYPFFISVGKPSVSAASNIKGKISQRNLNHPKSLLTHFF
ncbi:uncharacterized protein BYT42DRAFT_293058 [Radiomyces spectabilis]|uniref:uncharacterized protein n=1 Tax=Radiomyces spectabilis TaxID=64574 RepID=UPI00221FE375|nr:uncharacterized protein BYT42DRAFT_293058 [Radiomyces spectabilis]KAI8381119.1 hypothetical protein BYT42DRAFT_293058 [Radiomyces spectabilis]